MECVYGYLHRRHANTGLAKRVCAALQLGERRDGKAARLCASGYTKDLLTLVGERREHSCAKREAVCEN